MQPTAPRFGLDAVWEEPVSSPWQSYPGPEPNGDGRSSVYGSGHSWFLFCSGCSLIVFVMWGCVVLFCSLCVGCLGSIRVAGVEH